MRAGMPRQGPLHRACRDAVTLYSATYACPHCGQTHLVAGGEPGLGVVIENGLAQITAAKGLRRCRRLAHQRAQTGRLDLPAFGQLANQQL